MILVHILVSVKKKNIPVLLGLIDIAKSVPRDKRRKTLVLTGDKHVLAYLTQISLVV